MSRLYLIWKKEPLWLAPFGWIYGLIMRVRNLFYDIGIFRTHRVNIPVISVGNIVVGGSGKTPVTIALARSLAPKKVAILTRGYQSLAEHTAPEVAQDDWQTFGDEAVLMMRKLPEAIVIVGKDRVAGAKLAEQMGAEVIIMDDGMQHRRLHRDRNIVVVNEDLKAQHMFPRGRLREPLSGMKRADEVIHPSFVTSPRLDGKKVGIFCGIAKPERFRKTVEELGGVIVHEKFLPDHAPMSNLPAFIAACLEKGAEEILCTEKDFVKLDSNSGVTPICLDVSFEL